MLGRLTCFFTSLSISAGVFAQVIPNAGSIQRQLDQTPDLPAAKPAPPRLDTPALPVPAPQGDAALVVASVDVTGNTVYPAAQLIGIAAIPVGTRVTLAALQEGANRITRFYRSHGYLAATAFIPEQRLTQGRVRVLVREGRYGRIVVHAMAPVDAARVERTLATAICGARSPACADTVLGEDALNRALLLVGDLPGVTAAAVLQAGERAGTADLTVDARAPRRVTGMLAVDNFGNSALGHARVSGTVTGDSVLTFGDQAEFRAITSGDRLLDGGLTYSLPTGYTGNRLGAQVDYLRYRLGGDFSALGASGEATTLRLFDRYPIFRGARRNLDVEAALRGGYYSDETGVLALRQARRVGAAQLTLHGDSADGLLGGGYNTAYLSYSYGNLSLDDVAADAGTARAAGTFHKLNAGAVRVQSLGGRFSLYGAFLAQAANKNLDASEKLYLGGPYAVRAIPVDEIGGDQGAVLTAELRHTDAAPLLPGYQLVESAFYDHGWLQLTKFPWAGFAGPRYTSLGGPGLGLSLAKPGGLEVRAMVALRTSGAPVASSARKWLGWVQAAVHF